MADRKSAQAPVAPSRRSVELKAFDPSPPRSLVICREFAAEDRGVLQQRDTVWSWDVTKLLGPRSGRTSTST